MDGFLARQQRLLYEGPRQKIISNTHALQILAVFLFNFVP